MFSSGKIFNNHVFRHVTHIFPFFSERTFSSSGGLSIPPTYFRMKTQVTSVRTQCKNPHGFPSFSQKATFLVGARALWSRWRRHVRRQKKTAQKLEKHIFLSRTQCTKPSTGGPSTKQAPLTSCATSPTEQAPQSGTVVGCCAVSCFDLPS